MVVLYGNVAHPVGEVDLKLVQRPTRDAVDRAGHVNDDEVVITIPGPGVHRATDDAGRRVRRVQADDHALGAGI